MSFKPDHLLKTNIFVNIDRKWESGENDDGHGEGSEEEMVWEDNLPCFIVCNPHLGFKLFANSQHVTNHTTFSKLTKYSKVFWVVHRKHSNMNFSSFKVSYWGDDVGKHLHTQQRHHKKSLLEARIAYVPWP